MVEQQGAQTGPAPVWAPDGKQFAYLRGNRVMLSDVAAKAETELLTLDALEKAAVPVVEPQRFDWQNRRVNESSLEWSSSGAQLLLSVRGDLFLFSLASKKWEQLTATPEAERDPKLSPDGKRVAFRRGHDLYTMDLASRQVTRLTDDGSATLLNGELDWVYPEELDLGTAYWWSPDSQHIAYLQFDVSHEFVYPQVALGGLRAIAEPERYPQAGTPNPEVRLGVAPAAGGNTLWLDLGEPRGSLIARVYWAPDSLELAIERYNRVQNQRDLMVALPNGTSRVVLHESDPYWINTDDLFHFLSDGEFLWGSERDGFRHLYLYSLDGKLHKRLTEGNWEVTALAGVDESRQKIYFVSTQASPMERQLYSVRLNGKDLTRISQGEGTHRISMSPTCEYYMDTFSSLTEPPRKTVHRNDGEESAVFWDAGHKLADDYQILPVETVTVKADNGAPLYAHLIRPANFRAGEKYPAVVMVYGGPGAQEVVNAWRGADWAQVLAQRGFVIWQLDNRGSAGRGHAFESPLFHRFGKIELADQLEGVKYLVAQGFVDPARIGIYGWSYGGFMTLNALLNAPDVFRAGIAGAPVTNWRNYDTIYTERYLGLPAEDGEGYRASSPLEYAGKLKAKLLIVHNLEDDNVLFQNTLQMAEALERAGKVFQMVVYPQKTHAVGGPLEKQLLEETTSFFENNLKQ
ncbi:MAG TPA: S9 family peptidase [Bryobacteraceae bacterium]|nr:S9 family peptidase [Bryobacteraceae bacterium]